MDENVILGVTNDKWVTCGMVVLPIVLAHGFVKPQMVSKWQITIKGGLGEVFESFCLVCKISARRSLSESEFEFEFKLW